MASNGNTSDDQRTQISHLYSNNAIQAEETHSEDKAEEASRIQDIMNERDLYEKKLKALSLVMAAMEKENGDLKKEVGRYKGEVGGYERHIESAGACIGTLVTFMGTPTIVTNTIRLDAIGTYREFARRIQAGLMSALPK